MPEGVPARPVDNPRWRWLAGASLAFLCAVGASAQPPGPTRVDLLKEDLSAAGREAVQVRVDFPTGAQAPPHSHPGEEIAYVLAGVLEYRVLGKPAVTLRAGDALFIPSGAVHAVKNVGGEPASELATYVVEKGRPLIAPAR